jgi:transcription elongation factor GreA
VLQLGFQRGGALTTAGIATLGTNAIPIAAAMILFGEPLPNGPLGVVRVLSFAAVVAGAAALAPRQTTSRQAIGSRPDPRARDTPPTAGAARGPTGRLERRWWPDPIADRAGCGDAAAVTLRTGGPQKEDGMHDPVITRAGLARLSEELERLTTVERGLIAERLKHAATGEANPAENADYLDAREEQALLERRIALLEERLRAARVVEPRPRNGRVDIGERVRLRDLDSGERLELELVGPLEADPAAGRISVVSPVGKAIVGLRRGQIAGVDAPVGRRRFKVLAVEPPAPAA